MNEPTLIALLTLGGVALTAIGAFGGAWLTRRSSKEATQAQSKAAEDSAQDKLIDQLQEELVRYREANDKRVEHLEAEVQKLREENHGYRAFIGVQRDHMAEHGTPLPPWPDHLPR